MLDRGQLQKLTQVRRELEDLGVGVAYEGSYLFCSRTYIINLALKRFLSRLSVQ